MIVRSFHYLIMHICLVIHQNVTSLNLIWLRWEHFAILYWTYCLWGDTWKVTYFKHFAIKFMFFGFDLHTVALMCLGFFCPSFLLKPESDHVPIHLETSFSGHSCITNVVMLIFLDEKKENRVVTWPDGKEEGCDHDGLYFRVLLKKSDFLSSIYRSLKWSHIHTYNFLCFSW